jgi:hypothetical protein
MCVTGNVEASTSHSSIISVPTAKISYAGAASAIPPSPLATEPRTLRGEPHLDSLPGLHITRAALPNCNNSASVML